MTEIKTPVRQGDSPTQIVGADGNVLFEFVAPKLAAVLVSALNESARLRAIIAATPMDQSSLGTWLIESNRKLREDAARWQTVLQHLGGSVVQDSELTYFGVQVPSPPPGPYKNTASEFTAAIDALAKEQA